MIDTTTPHGARSGGPASSALVVDGAGRAGGASYTEADLEPRPAGGEVLVHLTASVVIPEGARLLWSQIGTLKAVVLPDGRLLQPWLMWERLTADGDVDVHTMSTVDVEEQHEVLFVDMHRCELEPS